MRKKYKLFILASIVIFTVLISSSVFNEKEKEENNSLITIFLEGKDKNTKVSEFPSKEDYVYSKMNCNNLNNNTEILPVFDEENWKLNINLNSLNKMKGNFNCEIYFKEKVKATDIIIAKYSENNTEGLIKVDQLATEQTKENTEYRYSGSNEEVKNYATFNGENWRIIGVFDVDDGTGKIEKRIKIIREGPIGSYSWDSTPSDINSGYGSNQWGPTGSYPGADLMQELNDTYYNSKSGTCYNSNNNGSTICNFTTTGLKEESRKMIDNAKWYTGETISNSSTSVTAAQAYTKERSNAVGSADSGQSITKTSNWTGKIAVMYPSDLTYGSKNCYSSSTTLWNYNNSSCANSNWLKGFTEWTLAPYESRSYRALLVLSTGYVGYSDTYCAYATRPVAYLSSRVQITKGTGESNTPYEFSL